MVRPTRDVNDMYHFVRQIAPRLRVLFVSITLFLFLQCLGPEPHGLDSNNPVGLLNWQIGGASVDEATTINLRFLNPNEVSNLQLWLEADALASSNGTSVSTWPDQSTNGFDATQGIMAQQPVYRTGILNGHPTLQFTTGNPGTHLTLGANYIFSAGDGLSIVAVASSLAEDDGRHFILDFGRVAGFGYGLGYSGNSDGLGNSILLYSANTSGGQLFEVPHQASSSDGKVITGIVKFDPAADKHQTLLVNGTTVVSTTSLTLTQLTANEICEFSIRGGGSGAPPAGCSTATFNGPVTIGGQSKTDLQSGRFFEGYIAMVLLYDKALTEDERQGLECYASIKYNIAVSHSCAD